MTGESEMLEHRFWRSGYGRGEPPFLREHRQKVAHVVETVCSHFGIARNALFSRSRTAWIVGPRSIAMYLIRKHTDLSYPNCGRIFGCHSSTILIACMRVEDRTRLEPAFAAHMAAIGQRLEHESAVGGRP